MEITQNNQKKSTWQKLATLSGLATLITACSSSPGEVARQKAKEASPQWQDGKFVNKLPREDGSIWKILSSMWNNPNQNKAPKIDPEEMLYPIDPQIFQSIPDTGLHLTWMGHSSILLEVEGHTVLTDPVWSDRCSPVSFIGPKRFHRPPVSLEELPQIDVVVISHDHYDHLDAHTIEHLNQKVSLFAVPLGIGEYLEDWGVPSEKIKELDWWDAFQHKGLTITATPARHFSGRLSPTGDNTLWAGWSIASANKKVFYSGDTAMFPEFKDIGDRLGPFDLTMIETGAYNQLWSDVHLGPEQAVKAHQMVQGKTMLPVHWGTFDLALHNWTEPVERVLAQAKEDNVTVFTPRPGQRFSVSREEAQKQLAQRWWPELPWTNAKKSPVVSSNLPANIYENVRDYFFSRIQSDSTLSDVKEEVTKESRSPKREAI